jgi:hypothetical protein
VTAKTIHLYKLLKLFGTPEQKLVSELRKELRLERRKQDAVVEEGGGDFHVPFWADAKLHVIGSHDLVESTEARVEASRQRKRLYPQLAKGFLDWFDRLRRSTNERVGWHEARIHSHYEMPEHSLTLKVDNLLCLQIGESRYRLIYPYFTEAPVLSEKWARVGLWLMAEALNNYSITDMEVLDILRSRSFSGASIFLKGDEEAHFSQRYMEVISEWDALRPEYGLD